MEVPWTAGTLLAGIAFADVPSLVDVAEPEPEPEPAPV
jgi:hypothetical protein